MSKTKLRYFTIADYEEEEIWLRNQHKNGLRLVKIVPPCFYIFEECTPEDVIYRLDYKNGSQSSEYIQIFRDYGWEYFEECVGWMYFRKPASQVETENDGEIFSDAQSKIDMIHHVIKTRMIPIFIIFLCCVIPNWVNAISGNLATPGNFFGIAFTVLMVLYLYLIISCGRKLRKLRKKYQQK